MESDRCVLGLDGEISVRDCGESDEVLQHAGDVLHGSGDDLVQVV